jgi:hypothetical protein
MPRWKCLAILKSLSHCWHWPNLPLYIYPFGHWNEVPMLLFLSTYTAILIPFIAGSHWSISVLPVDEEWMVEWVGIHVDTVLCQVIHFFLELCHSCGWFLSLVRDPFQFYWPSINMIAIFCIKAPVIRVAEFSSGKWEKKGLTRWMSILLRLGTSVPVRKGNSCFCVSIKWD